MKLPTSPKDKSENLHKLVSDYSQTRPGDNNYRAYIGPPHQYDFMGNTQFRLATTLGIREHHYYMDIGCGSLRSGKFLINYLLPERYHAI